MAERLSLATIFVIVFLILLLYLYDVWDMINMQDVKLKTKRVSIKK
jgi:hypothetical protein